MIFLGLAANYSASGVFRHLFATGTQQNSEDLRQFLAEKYSTQDGEIDKTKVALYHNGRSALMVALKNLLPKRSEVIVNGFTCQAVVQAVKEAKCLPVYADIDPETLHFNAKTLRACLRKHPEAKALIIQNSLGNPAPITEIEKVAKQHKLVIIEDLAHCVGLRYADGREAGTVGAAAALSFGKGKSIDTISGGALIMRDGEKTPYQPMEKPLRADRWRDRWYPFFGLVTRGLYHVGLGKYFMSFLVKTRQVQRSADGIVDPHIRLTHWQAKLALTQLQLLQLLPAVGQAPLRYHYLVEDREDVLEKMEREKCYLREFWYDTPIAPQRYYARQKFPEDECPVAVEVCTQIVNLPTWYTEEELRPALAIVRGEDPHQEERDRREAKRAAKEAKAQGLTEKTESDKTEATSAAEKRPAKRSRHDRRNQKLLAEKGGDEAEESIGFRMADVDFIEIYNEEVEAKATPIGAALAPVVHPASVPAVPRKISNKAPQVVEAPKVKTTTPQVPAARTTTPAKSAPAAPRPLLKSAAPPEQNITHTHKVMKSAPVKEAIQPVTMASKVLKSKATEQPKIDAKKNEFFEKKGGKK